MPAHLLAVDPGIRGCGAALFREGLLVRASYVKNPEKKDNGPHAARRMAFAVVGWAQEGTKFHPPEALAFEWPQVYTQGQLKGDPNDLLPLAAVDGAIAAAFTNSVAVHYLPKEWKGQLTKEACHARIMQRLSADEARTIDDSGALTHNTLDAVGIGLWHLGRFTPRKVIAR